jgi:hypothetical protein
VFTATVIIASIGFKTTVAVAFAQLTDLLLIHTADR